MWAIQFGGYDFCNASCNDADLSGYVYPEGTVYTQFIPFNDDYEVSNYKIVSGSLVYIPTNTIVANLPAFKAAIFQDPNVSLEAKIQLPLTYALLDTYVYTTGVVSQYWAGLKAMNYSWLDSNTITAVEGYATQFHIPLT